MSETKIVATQTFAHGNGIIVTVALGRIKTSPDGELWTHRHPGDYTYFTDVRWSERAKTFLAIGKKGRLTTSYDGCTWTERNSTLAGDLSFVPVYTDWLITDTRGDFVASPDGIIWEKP